MNWMKSIPGAITLSFLALLVFLGRTFIDFYYVYDEFNLGVGMITLVVLINMLLFGGWIWGLMSAGQEKQRGHQVLFGLNLFFFLLIAVGTLVSYCPSPCRTGWPLGEAFIWLSFGVGLLASLSSGFQVFRPQSSA